MVVGVLEHLHVLLVYPRHFYFVGGVVRSPLVVGGRRWWLGVAAGLSLLLCAGLYAELWLPAWSAPSPTAPRLRVMTYNILGTNQNWPAIRHTLEQANADVIALQELSPAIAAEIQANVLPLYPYQILSAQEGLISRYPVTLTAASVPGGWGSPPQVYRLDFAGQSVTFINAHFYASVFGFDFAYLDLIWHAREQQARDLAAFAAQQTTPVLVTADFNATDQSYAYRLMTQNLRDTWRAGGIGLGHTFPGGVSPGMWHPQVLGQPWPMWLARIDYIFASPDWQVIQAQQGEWDGVSDHQPVVAELDLP